MINSLLLGHSNNAPVQQNYVSLEPLAFMFPFPRREWHKFGIAPITPTTGGRWFIRFFFFCIIVVVVVVTVISDGVVEWFVSSFDTSFLEEIFKDNHLSTSWAITNNILSSYSLLLLRRDAKRIIGEIGKCVLRTYVAYNGSHSYVLRRRGQSIYTLLHRHRKSERERQSITGFQALWLLYFNKREIFLSSRLSFLSTPRLFESNGSIKLIIFFFCFGKCFCRRL